MRWVILIGAKLMKAGRNNQMLGDVLIQTNDGKVYFSEGGKAFQLITMEKPDAAEAPRHIPPSKHTNASVWN